MAGRFTTAGRPGLNNVPFRGRIRGRLLRAGVYTIVPQATARGVHLRGPRVAIMVDARGVHPTARVPSEFCRSATKSQPVFPVTPRYAGVPITPRYAGVAGAIRTEPASHTDKPATRADTSVDTSRESKAWVLPGTGETWRTLAILMSLLASAMLLALAALEPLYAVQRFRLVRGLDAHRGQVAFSGAAFLIAAGLLFLLPRLSI